MKSKEVISIFEDFEEDEDLTYYEKVKGVLKDVEDKKVWSLWKTFDGYDEKDFMVFKGSVLEYYLGAKKTAKYFLDQLEDEDIHTMTHSPNGEFRHRTSAAGVLIALTANVRARYRAKRHIYTDPNANP